MTAPRGDRIFHFVVAFTAGQSPATGVECARSSKASIHLRERRIDHAMACASETDGGGARIYVPDAVPVRGGTKHNCRSGDGYHGSRAAGGERRSLESGADREGSYGGDQR